MPPSSEMPSRLLTIELPEDALVMAAARDGAIADRDLDALEAWLHSVPEPETGAAAALTVGRAGRSASAEALQAYRAHLEAGGHEEHASVLRLALDLLQLRPHPRVERAESGYRYTDPVDGSTLYVEDPLAAYWHRRSVWGPPLRPRVEEEDVLGEPEACLAAALDGRLARIEVRTNWLASCFTWVRNKIVGRLENELLAEPAASPANRRSPVWLTRAGLARDRNLNTLVRWSQLASIGFFGEGRRRRVALQPRSGPLLVLPNTVWSAEDLHSSVEQLTERAAMRTNVGERWPAIRQ